jgi:hypothetical protein
LPARIIATSRVRRNVYQADVPSGKSFTRNFSQPRDFVPSEHNFIYSRLQPATVYAAPRELGNLRIRIVEVTSVKGRNLRAVALARITRIA